MLILNLQAMLPNVTPDLRKSNAAQKDIWLDARGRSLVTKNLILDTNAGMLAMMVGYLPTAHWSFC